MIINKISSTYTITDISNLLLNGELEISYDNSIYRFFGTVKYNNEDLKICAFEYKKEKGIIELFTTNDTELKSLTMTLVCNLLLELRLFDLR